MLNRGLVGVTADDCGYFCHDGIDVEIGEGMHEVEEPAMKLDYIGGRINGQLAMDPSGGVPMNAVLTGLTYVNGPMTLGAEIGMINSQGDARLVGISQRRETEIAFGGNYKLAPGLNLVGEYQYEYRHQGGYDFANGGLGAGTTATTPGLTRDAHGQSVVFSTVLTW